MASGVDSATRRTASFDRDRGNRYLLRATHAN
jgi:hypothetical protein